MLFSQFRSYFVNFLMLNLIDLNILYFSNDVWFTFQKLLCFSPRLTLLPFILIILFWLKKFWLFFSDRISQFVSKFVLNLKSLLDQSLITSWWFLVIWIISFNIRINIFIFRIVIWFILRFIFWIFLKLNCFDIFVLWIQIIGIIKFNLTVFVIFFIPNLNYSE